MLDTNVVSHIMQGRDAQLPARLTQLPLEPPPAQDFAQRAQTGLVLSVLPSDSARYHQDRCRRRGHVLR